MPTMNVAMDTLIELMIANRILANEGVVDGFGHISVRHPHNPERFIMSRSRIPILVTVDDLMEFDLSGEPIDQRDRPVNIERFIHASILEARPDINSVVHNHSHAVIPFGVTGTPIRTIFHTAAGIGQETPIWDISDAFGDTNMLVVNMDQGRDLAKRLGNGRVVLMRGHGCCVAGPNIKEAVVVANYLQINARMQMDAMTLGEVKFLSPKEEELYSEINFQPLSINRSWQYFCIRAGFGDFFQKS